MTRLAPMFVLAAAMISCAETETTVTGYAGSRPIGTRRVRQWLYGKQSSESLLFAERAMGNLDIGFGKLASMFASLVGAYVAGDVAKAREVTSQMATAGATKTQIAQIDAAAKTEAARIAANSGAYKTAVEAGAPATVGTVIPPKP